MCCCVAVVTSSLLCSFCYWTHVGVYRQALWAEHNYCLHSLFSKDGLHKQLTFQHTFCLSFFFLLTTQLLSDGKLTKANALPAECCQLKLGNPKYPFPKGTVWSRAHLWPRGGSWSCGADHGTCMSREDQRKKKRHYLFYFLHCLLSPQQRAQLLQFSLYRNTLMSAKNLVNFINKHVAVFWCLGNTPALADLWHEP